MRTLKREFLIQAPLILERLILEPWNNDSKGASQAE